jgi:hypothetical protein
MSYYDDEDYGDYIDYEAYVDYGDHIDEGRRNKLPYSYLTEKDVEELLTLDSDLAQDFTWIWRRAIANMGQEFKDELKAAEAARLAPPLPHKSYHDWWKAEQKAKTKRRKAWRDAARHAAEQEVKRAEQETEDYKALVSAVSTHETDRVS